MQTSYYLCAFCFFSCLSYRSLAVETLEVSEVPNCEDDGQNCRASASSLLQVAAGRTPQLQSGGGFSLATETVEVAENLDLHVGSPVQDHWSCHQVQRRSLQELPKSKSVAVLIPFREQTGQERHRELAALLDVLLPFAESKKDEGISFKFIVIEQSGNGHFNRGALMNVGFQVAEAFNGQGAFTAVAQDCDFVPDEGMIQWYTRTGEAPIHLASYVYCPGFGGVTIFSNDQYRSMDGYSHSMWGWGGEDDDAMDRWMAEPSRIVIAPSGPERFKDLGRSEDKARDKASYQKSMKVWKADNQDQNWVNDGLTGLRYTLVAKVPHKSPMVEHVVVELAGAATSSL